MRVLGFEVTLDQEALQLFIAKVAEQYDQLEAACVPLDTRVAELSKEEQACPVAYWEQVAEVLASLREASSQCLTLFARGRPEAIPIVFSALSVTFRCDLRCIAACLERADMQLATASASCEVAERQRLLMELRQLAQVVHQCVTRARTELDEAPEEQRKILSGGDNHAAER
jgi:hypothetical protein